MHTKISYTYARVSARIQTCIRNNIKNKHKRNNAASVSSEYKNFEHFLSVQGIDSHDLTFAIRKVS